MGGDSFTLPAEASMFGRSPTPYEVTAYHEAGAAQAVLEQQCCDLRLPSAGGDYAGASGSGASGSDRFGVRGVGVRPI